MVIRLGSNDRRRFGGFRDNRPHRAANRVGVNDQRDRERQDRIKRPAVGLVETQLPRAKELAVSAERNDRPKANPGARAREDPDIDAARLGGSVRAPCHRPRRERAAQAHLDSSLELRLRNAGSSPRRASEIENEGHRRRWRACLRRGDRGRRQHAKAHRGRRQYDPCRPPAGQSLGCRLLGHLCGRLRPGVWA